MANTAFSARIIDENPAHRLRGRGEEMPSVLPALLIVGAEAQPDLVDKRGGLERVSGRLGGHLIGSQLAQFFVDGGQQLLGGLGIALLNRVQDARDFAHGALNELNRLVRRIVTFSHILTR